MKKTQRPQLSPALTLEVTDNLQDDSDEESAGKVSLEGNCPTCHGQQAYETDHELFVCPACCPLNEESAGKAEDDPTPDVDPNDPASALVSFGHVSFLMPSLSTDEPGSLHEIVKRRESTPLGESPSQPTPTLSAYRGTIAPELDRLRQEVRHLNDLLRISKGSQEGLWQALELSTKGYASIPGAEGCFVVDAARVGEWRSSLLLIKARISRMVEGGTPGSLVSDWLLEAREETKKVLSSLPVKQEGT